jgi:putative sterol carrier protein
MAVFTVPEHITVDDFYKDYVPKHFKEITAGMDVSAMAGKEFTLQFTIEGKSYCLKMMGGKEIEIIEGGINKPMLTVALSESDWRDSITGKIEGILDRFTDPTQVADTARYTKLLSTKGTLNLELTKDDGTVMPITMIFNGEDKPSVAMKLALSDWVAMQRKEVNGQVLFMSGKMRATGDMVFLMSLQQLV